jgi:hypothetical protein
MCGSLTIQEFTPQSLYSVINFRGVTLTDEEDDYVCSLTI